MSLEARQSLGFSLGHEGRFELHARRSKGQVHQRPAVFPRRPPEEVRGIDGVVHQPRLGLVGDGRGLEATPVEEPPDDPAHDIDAEDRRRVVARPLLGVDAVAKHGRQVAHRALEQFFADDHECDPGRSQILLGSGVDDPVASDVDRTREEITARVACEP